MVELSRPTAAQCSSRIALLCLQYLRPAPHIPVIGMPGHNAQRDALASSTNHQFGMWFLHRLRIERRIGKLVVAAIEVTSAAGPERPDHFARLIQPLQAFAHRVKRQAVSFVFVLLPARSEAEQQPTA